MEKKKKMETHTHGVEKENVFQLCNDEPVTGVESDSLGRARLVEQLVAAVKSCETPFVVAINGGWGTGKTSVLKCLEQEFQEKQGEKKKTIKIRTVWFSPWKFQFEDSPAVSLLQTIRSTAEEKQWISFDRTRRKTTKLLDIVGSLAGEIVLKTITGHTVSTRDIMAQGGAFEEKYFEAKQLTSRMQEEFQAAIEDLVGKDGRLILFIDDLDRCCTENALRLLEALKLFLNARNCVYVIAMDMENLARNLESESKISCPASYLEKIFQLVYTLPAPGHEAKWNMVVQLLRRDEPDLFSNPEINQIKYDLSDFIGDNPRALKHFCNRFCLERAMMRNALGKSYQAHRHIFLQILQRCYPTVFKLFRTGPYHIVVHPNPSKRFDKFIRDWYHLFQSSHPAANSTGSGASEGQERSDITPTIEPQTFGDYSEHMPDLGHASSLEEPYRFVTAILRVSDKPAIICMENHPRNTKIEPGSNLSEMDDLSGAMLRDLNLSGCLLDRCDFSRADLSKTNLSVADCSRSIFKEVLFAGGQAEGTIFRDADLQGLSYQGANLDGADFSGARNLPGGLKKESKQEEKA